ncbi:MAG: hypothetical protein HQL57_01605 [Magnetococcales bacterium]|nr:hypothetical protein [Magnetococcales bacterium]MBF0155865.1 hypothetical protein [Magnetococcales bacterium]
MIYRRETGRHPIEVIDHDGFRSLHFDRHSVQSRMALDDPLALVLPYTRFLMASLLFLPSPTRALMIGLGGGSVAKYLLHHLPALGLDVVEPDPQVIWTSHEFFYLPRTERLSIHKDDGCHFIRAAQKRPAWPYDLVLIDAFDEAGMVAPVYGRSMISGCHALLETGGVIGINLGKSNKALRSQVLTSLDAVFPRSWLRLPVPHTRNEIALAFGRRTGWRDLESCRRRAVSLGERMSLEWDQFVDTLIQANKPPFWRRLWSWEGA